MIATQHLRAWAVAALLGVAAAASAPAQLPAQFSGYSASGTHTCGEGAGARTCIVTGLSFSNCIDATSSLRLQDCCWSSQICRRDPNTGEQRCEGGTKSVGFHLNYCIGR